nr:hypothetical protein [Tanacetum cinerariifolium]
MVTVAPTSPRPVTVVPVALMARSVSGTGAVVSPAVTSLGTEEPPSTVLAVTSRIWPLVCAGLSVTVKVPGGGVIARGIGLNNGQCLIGSDAGQVDDKGAVGPHGPGPDLHTVDADRHGRADFATTGELGVIRADRQ